MWWWFCKRLNRCIVRTSQGATQNKRKFVNQKDYWRNYATLNFGFLLDMHDQVVNRTNDKRWLAEYIEKPRVVMEKKHS